MEASNPYRIVCKAIAPEPVSQDEVRQYFENLERRRAVNPKHISARIMKR